MNYYNENDPKAAQWLRDLIWVGAISDGEVDTRSIEDVTPNDLSGYTQCHFFAGIGGWSLALRLAGWPDDEPVWTGSCPCQPFSAAGKSGGFADERHLWPAFYHLIEQRKPPVVFGEQVASPDGLAWLDLVQTDLEAARYAVGAADICAAGVGAPHIRQRLYWVGVSNSGGRSPRVAAAAPNRHWRAAESAGSAVRLADTDGARYQGQCRSSMPRTSESERPWSIATTYGGADGERLGNADVPDETRQRPVGIPVEPEQKANRRRKSTPWAGWQLVRCADSRARPVEPGTFPLAHGVPGRVGLLRGYGNAIVPQVAAEFIGAYLDAI